jgi:CRISPR-associated protein Cas5t
VIILKEFIYLDIYGTTASFKVPQIYQGHLLSLPVPAYSTILGIISTIVGREIKTSDTKIAFKYAYKGKGVDLETYHRWERSATGNYKYQSTAVRSREVHYDVRLQILLDNIELYQEIINPKKTITLGRSQDIATILEIKKIRGKSVEKGKLGASLIKLEDLGNQVMNGLFYNLPENFDYEEGYVRLPKTITRYFAITENELDISIPNLIQLDELDNNIFYLHQWSQLENEKN